ncbi:alpha/beta fold hydrolase [Sorangium sp. So ce1024]|uniref:alpha/beta fold hydrolase n=1 Tax=Sorangium sp. So ce1024 TaxID=3133327 RepID=UPI003F0849A4
MRVGPGFGYLGERERQFGIYRRASFLTAETVIAKDGRPLTVLSAGSPEAPTVVLVNALGVSCLFLVRLAEALSRDHRVVTWETRGLPDYYPDDVAAGGEWDPETHARDLGDVLAAAGRGRVDSVVSYCSGSYLTLYATARGVIAPRRVALISPPLELQAEGEKTLYQRTFPPLLTRMARSGPAMAAIVRGIMRQGARRAEDDVDEELHALNDLPFARDETTHRYARLHAPWLALPWADLLRKVAAPTAIFHGTEDEIVHPDTVAALAAAIPDAGLRLYERQGHFAVYRSEALLQDVVRFVTAGPAPAGEAAAPARSRGS